MKRLLGSILAFTVLCLALTATALAQDSGKEKPAQPRRPLPKPEGGSRGFEQYAKRDASSRLIAAAATRNIDDPAIPAYERGTAEYAATKYKEAVDDLSEATKLSPNWPEPHYALALSLTEIRKLKEAIEEFKVVLKLNAKNELKILSYYNLGNTYSDLGQYKEAVESYKQAIQLNPKLSKPHYNLGLVYVALDQFENAVEEFKQAAQLRPDYSEARYNLGLAYLQLGQKHEAEEQRQILAKLNPELANRLDALIKK
jgi:tetratricopeptide (TPR) repeat protein